MLALVENWMDFYQKARQWEQREFFAAEGEPSVDLLREHLDTFDLLNKSGDHHLRMLGCLPVPSRDVERALPLLRAAEENLHGALEAVQETLELWHRPPSLDEEKREQLSQLFPARAA